MVFIFINVGLPVVILLAVASIAWLYGETFDPWIVIEPPQTYWLCSGFVLLTAACVGFRVPFTGVAFAVAAAAAAMILANVVVAAIRDSGGRADRTAFAARLLWVFSIVLCLVGQILAGYVPLGS